MSVEWLLISIGILGLLFGSLAGAMSYRIPREIPLGLFKKTRSYCPNCETNIPWYYNIPVISFLYLKGKCFFCEKTISKDYLYLELLTPVIFVLVTWVFTMAAPFEAFSLKFWMALFVNLYFFWSLLVTTFIDIEFRIIPDRFSLGNWVIGLLFSFLIAEISWIDSLTGSLLGYGLFWSISTFYEKVRKMEGLGMGDVKMMGWLGAWMGFESIVYIILSASLSGLLYGVLAMSKSRQGLQTAIPFGPFLAFGAALTWFLLKLQILA